MATILYDAEGNPTRVEDATRVAAMLENGYRVEKDEGKPAKRAKKEEKSEE
jgi:hypothetical protein